MLRVELLGGFRLSSDGAALTAGWGARSESLLAYLVLHAGEFVPRQRLAFLFWPDSGESQARTNLRQLLHHLRTAWPEVERYLETAGRNIRWRSEAPFELDTAQFETAIAAGGEAVARRESTAAARCFETALALYRGELLAGYYDDWIEAERPRFRAKYKGALECLATLYEQAREFPAAIRAVEALLAHDPLAEPGWQKLIRLHSLNGDRSSALRAYDRCADTLRRELGTDPGPATRRARDQASAAPSPPPQPETARLVGRKTEWAALSEIWRETCTGRASFALVTGEPGIGKTTLIGELLAAAAGQGASTAEAACYPVERPMAYAAIAAWLRSPALRPAIDRLPAGQRSQLSRALPELLAAHPELGEPQPFTESWQRHHFFEALAQALWNAPAPLLLFLDDAQWCDPETLEWLLYLLRANPRAKLMVAAAARFEDVGREHPVAMAIGRLLRAGAAAEIALDPLSEQETAQLAAQLSTGPVDLAPLYTQTGGNPLFIVETMRAGMVVSRKVQSVITMRLGQLTVGTRELAADAAAVGRPFTAELLERAGCGSDTAIAAAIDELFARRILHARGGDAYDFSHGQLREVAYQQLGPARRRLTHRHIAQALEGFPGDADSAEIASHYERSGDAARAIGHLERASGVARRRYAEDEAIAYLTRALPLLESLPAGRERDGVELNLLVALGAPLMATEGYASAGAGRVYARARMLCELAGESDAWLPVLSGSWAFHAVKGELAASLEIATRFVRLARQKQDDATLLHAALFCRGSTLCFMGRMGEAREHFQASLDQYAARTDPRPFYGLGPELSVFCRSHVSHALWFQGHLDQALAEIHATIAHAQGLAHPFSLALALAYAAMLHQFRGEAAPAEERAEEAAELCRKHDFRYYLSWTPIIHGWAQARRGAASGMEAMRAGLAALQATGANLRAPYYLTMLAQACGEAGRTEEGLAYVAEAVAAGSRGGEHWVRSELERVRGDLLLDAGNRQEALAAYHTALRTAHQQGALVFELRAAVALARLSGDRARLASVYERFAEGFDTADLAHARALLAAGAAR